MIEFLVLLPKSEDFDYGKNKEGFKNIFLQFEILKCFLLKCKM